MSGGIKWALLGGVLLVLVVGILVFSFAKPPPDAVDTPPTAGPSSPVPVLPAVDTASGPALSDSDSSLAVSTADIPAFEREYDDVASPEEGLNSMGQSLSRGDDRTPALAEDTPREKPTPDVLNDPAAYEAFETSQSRRIAAGYLGIINQVPAMRARIEQAKVSGDMSPEEIAEAEEVVEKILELEREMAARDPGIIDEVRKASPAPTTQQ